MITTVASILDGKFTMKLDKEDDEDKWFLDWVLQSPTQAGKHLTAGWYAYQTVLKFYRPEDIKQVHECFGGMGAQSLMIQDLFYTTYHSVGEYSMDAVRHLERVLPPECHVSLADAYDPTLNLTGVDLVGLDFGDLTAWKTRDGEAHRRLLDKTFAAHPKAVVFTDIAKRYLHLHRSRYETLLGTGTCDSYPDYLQALLDRLHGLYGYRLAAGYHDYWSTVMTLVPDEVRGPRAALEPTPATPVGLVLL